MFKLEPGCMLTMKSVPPKVALLEPIAVGQQYETIKMRCWWSLGDTVAGREANAFESELRAVDEIETILTRAVHGQSLADAPRRFPLWRC